METFKALSCYEHCGGHYQPIMLFGHMQCIFLGFVRLISYVLQQMCSHALTINVSHIQTKRCHFSLNMKRFLWNLLHTDAGNLEA